MKVLVAIMLALAICSAAPHFVADVDAMKCSSGSGCE